MKNLTMMAAATLLLTFFAITTSVSAGEPRDPAPAAGQVPTAMLSNLGLAGLQRMSDHQGRAIRGSGFSFAFSISRSVGGATNRSSTYTPGQFVWTSSSGGGGFSFGGAVAFAN